MSPAQVVIYSPMWDTGGQGWRIKRGFDRYLPEEFKVRSIATHTSFFDYPNDLLYKPEEAYQLFAEADVIHMRNGVNGLTRLLKDRKKAPAGLIVHYHGTRFREYSQLLSNEARELGAVQIVSTLDLTLLDPEVQWLPAPFDIMEIERYRPADPPTGPVRICHAPTNRQAKSTARIMQAIRYLKGSGFDIVFDLIERQPWEETLKRKGKADIVIDQLELGIGNNALEAFGMAIPVISGVRSPAVRDKMLEVCGSLPFLEADEDNLELQLARLIDSAELRQYWGMIGFEYLLKWHKERSVINRLAEIYRGVL